MEGRKAAQTLTLALAALAGTAHARQAVPLLAEGERLLDQDVTNINSPTLLDDGSWCADVQLDGHGQGVVLNGELVAGPGMDGPGGELMHFAWLAGLEPDGRLSFVYGVWGNGFATLNSRLVIDDGIALATGDALDAPSAPAGAWVKWIYGARVEGPWALVGLKFVDGAGLETDAAVLYSVDAAGQVSLPTILEAQDRPSTAAGYAVEDVPRDLALNGSGLTAVGFTFSGAGSHDSTGGSLGGSGIYVHGTPGPLPGSMWCAGYPNAEVNEAGDHAVGGGVVVPWIPSLGLFDGRGVVTRTLGGVEELMDAEGRPLRADPAEIVADFGSTDVALADDGTTVYAVPLESGGSVLTDGDSILLREGAPIAGGGVVQRLQYYHSLGAPTAPRSVAVAPGGGAVLAVVDAGSGHEVLVRIERPLGSATSCVALPNSLGEVGGLDLVGDDRASANDLRARASGLPTGQFALLMGSRTALTSGVAVPGCSGALCLAGQISFLRARVERTDPSGQVEVPVDLGALPFGSGSLAAQAGETWTFQLWHRDVAPGGAPTSNMTEARAITLR